MPTNQPYRVWAELAFSYFWLKAETSGIMHILTPLDQSVKDEITQRKRIDILSRQAIDSRIYRPYE